MEWEKEFAHNIHGGSVNETERFQLAGWRTQASNLKKKVKEQDQIIEILNAQVSSLIQEKHQRFEMVMIERGITLRREHLITLHNSLEFIRRYGAITPNSDYGALGFTDHRTLQRTCNKFVEDGMLVKIQGNPTSYSIPTDE
jgi:hypothetical protein